MRLNSPHVFCDVVIAATPIRKRARVMNMKKASEARLCGRMIVRGNMPIAKSAIEPRTRLTIPQCPSRFDRRLFLKPRANIRLNIPVKISP